MINQTSYEKFGDDLYIGAEKVVYSILRLMFFLNKQVIKEPENIYKYQTDYNKKLDTIGQEFETSWKDWVSGGLSIAYLAGLTQANSQLAQFGLNTKIIKSLDNFKQPLLKVKIADSQFSNLGFSNFSILSKYPQHQSLLGAFQAAAYNNLQNQKFQIVRKGQDIFREISMMAGEKHYKDADIFTRRKLSQYLLDEYARKGIQTITYKNGAKYSIDSYCEMLGRTMTGRAAVQASLNRFFESGYTLVVVSAHFRACDLCTPYEGKILSIEQHPQYESLADAELQGLFHPRCAHDVSAFWEGKNESELPRVNSGEQELIDKYGYNEAQKLAYEAQQKQRYIERNIRNWKRRELVALSEKEKKYANKKIRDWQKQQREHLKENAFLHRKYSREQINRAY